MMLGFYILCDTSVWVSVSHLHLQLSDVVGGPRLVVVVIVRDGGETSRSVLWRDPVNARRADADAAATVQVLCRTSWTDPGLRDPDGNGRCLKALTLQDLHVDDVRSLRRSKRRRINICKDTPLNPCVLSVKCVWLVWGHLVFGVEDHGLGVGDPADVVLVFGRGQPHSCRQLVVEQRQLWDQTLGFLLFGRQRGQTLPDAEQRLDELPLRTETLRLKITVNTVSLTSGKVLQKTKVEEKKSLGQRT